MLLKCSNSDRKVIITSSKGSGSGASLARGTGMRMTMSTASTMTPRIHRKGFRTPSKRYPGKALPGKLHSMSRIGPGKIGPGKKIISRPNPPPCDNSNDSGFGFDQHVEHVVPPHSHQQMIRTVPLSRSDYHDDSISTDGSDDLILSTTRIQARTKRRKIESPSIIHIDNEDACSDDAFIQKIATTTASAAISNSLPCTATPTPNTITKYYTNGAKNTTRLGLKRPSSQMQTNTYTTSKDGRVQLEIIQQPEQQHRARYQTEGSRGAVKDRSGNGFPIVKLNGYNRPTTLQVFIGTDIGRIAPHMFYQACKVAGKNSTPCNEKKVDGTMIIEIDFKPESEMTITCDCVGILKERNVDVEHRFPDHSTQRNKKKSTRCRMVFRTQLQLDDGTTETLQVCSQPIICTQPPGVPEICKKSLISCPVDGGLELYVIGKNFLKDTVVIFRENDDDMGQLGSVWEQTVVPDKEYLQQTHLICVVPPYIQQNIIEPITIQLFIMSSGKRSESHNFVYLPKGTHSILSASTTLSTLRSTISGSQDVLQYTDNQTQPTLPQSLDLWSTNSNTATSTIIEPKHELDSGMMPPPSTTTVPICVRRPSNGLMQDQIVGLQQIVTNNNSNVVNTANNNNNLKTEMIDENSQNSMSSDQMQTETTFDQLPTVTNNDNSLEQNSTNNFRIRKSSLHIMDMPGILDDDNMQGFSNNTQTTVVTSGTTQNQSNDINTMSVAAAAAAAVAAVELAVKQEQIANEIQNNIFNAAVVAQNQQQVDKFLCSLDTSLNGLNKVNNGGVQLNNVVDPVVNSMFVNAAAATNVVSNETTNLQNHGLFSASLQQSTQQTTSHNDIVGITSQSVPQQQTIGQQFSTNSTALTTPINQILNLTHDSGLKLLRSSSTSSNCSSSSSSSSSSISPQVHHDLILNSEPAASINSVNMQIISQSSNSSSSSQQSPSPSQISTDLILNSAVPPSIMCSPNSDSMLVSHHHHHHPLHQVTIPTTILNSLQSQNAQETIINNIIMQQHHHHQQHQHQHQQQQHQQQQPQQQTTQPIIVGQQQQQASTANANMIIKAAADYISCQEQHIRTTESTINALISLNSNPIMSTEQQQQVTQILNISPNSSISSSSPQSNSQSPKTQSNELIQTTVAQPSSPQQRQQQILNPFTNSVTNTAVPLVNILLNHHDSPRSTDYLANNQGTQILQAVSPQQNQESLLHAVSLAAQNSGLEKPNLSGGSTVEQIAAIAVAAVAQTTQTPVIAPATATATTAIPQELTTMSDQDLISYINPSAFDQI